jgi:hypothetical protein
MTLNFKGAAKRIEDLDIPRIAATIGCGEDHLHAFMDVEAAGSGFDSQGRPKMLFEPHVFYRNLQGEKRERAVSAGLAYKSWKQNYPKDSYPRLFMAMDIDETAALKAASWGLGQILGENHKLVGYATPQAMVRAFVEDEETHLEAIVAFLKGKGLDKHLRAENWAKVAEGYNGAQYAKNGYHTKMRAAFAKWQKIKDTPWPAATPAVAPEPAKPAPAPVATVAAPEPKPAPAPAPAPRMDGTFTAPKSETSLWGRIINRLIGREP